MSEKNNVLAEKRAIAEEKKLRQWNAVLDKNPEMADKAMRRAMGLLLSSNDWSPYDLDRFWSQMKSGVSCPADFGLNEFDMPRVA